LAEELRALAEQRHRPPGAKTTRTYGVSTLERWLYAYRATHTLEALRPRGRSDRGRGRELTPDLRELLCDIRRECPAASVPLILRTLEAIGRIEKGEVKASTVRRLFSERKLVRTSSTAENEGKTRLRWQAEAPDALWHGDVCHGPTLKLEGKKTPIRVHGLLDDCSRYVIALEARDSEMESDMLAILVRALRTHGKPDALYLDNGPTYCGEALKTACGRLGISLLHAKPYDPQARGKMERFWRTLREKCLAHLGHVSSLDDVNARLATFLKRHYQDEPHAGLLGVSPTKVYEPSTRSANVIDEQALRAALAVQERRRVGQDSTLKIEGKLYELNHGYLAGRVVTVGYSLFDTPLVPWVEEDGRRLALHLVDVKANGTGKRPSRHETPPPPVKPTGFDPSASCAPTKTLEMTTTTATREDEEDEDALF
jgi:transposase InsO family protein